MSIQAQSINEEIINTLNQENLNLIKELFILIISELNESLQLKNKLFSIHNFFPDILFLKLDYFSKKNINTKDISHYLEQHNYKFNDEIIRRFIKQYDKNGNCNLIYEDFLRLISPSNNNIKIYKDSNIEEKADDIFCDILIKELKLIGFIGEMIIQIKKKNEFDSYNIFMEISKNSEYLNKIEINNFLDEKFTEIEINQLIYYLDSNNDGLITYEDFHDLLIPIKSDNKFEENVLSIKNNVKTFNKNINYPEDNMIYNQENISNNNLLLNQEEYPINNDINFNEFKDLDCIKENINEKNINNKNYESIGISQNMENNKNNYKVNEGFIENTKNNFNKSLYNKYLNDNFFDKKNEMYNDNKYKTANDFIPKILKEEKLDIPNIKENTIYSNFINNPNQKAQLNNDNFNFYQKDNYISKVSELPQVKEKDNYNRTLQRFPITFGYENNLLNNELENNNNIPKYNNKNEIDYNNQMILTNDNKRIINYKDQIDSKELSKENINFNLKKKGNNSLNKNSKGANEKNQKINKISYIIDEGINIFLEYIKLITLNENKIEHLKENLALREDLSLKEIFVLFDKEQLNYISVDNFQLICKKIFNLFPTLDQIKLLFKRYKKELIINKKEKDISSLNREEFIQMMIPKKLEYANIINKQNKTDKTDIKLSIKSKKILTQLIKILIQKETNYYKVKRKIRKNSLEIIWKEISKYSKNKGKIDKNEMNKFLEEYGYFLGKNQIDNIFLIFDRDQKGNINDNDFLEEMSY